jgi:hypothetical protein
MAWKRTFAPATMACTLWLACGLEHVGTGETADASTEVEAGAAPDTGAAPKETGPACVPMVQITDPLTTIDTTRWQVVKDGSNGDHPKVVTGGESPLTGAVLSLVLPGSGNSRGGVWLMAPVPTRAFDVKLSTYVQCGGACADGLVIVWASTTDRTLLDTAPSGRALGIPAKSNGGALLLDLYQNVESSDPPTPNLSVLQLDGTKNPGDYAWSKASTPKTDSLLGTEHTLELRLRKGMLEVKVDGATVANAPTGSGFPALFGVTAATGADKALFLIRNFSGAFYDCDAP